MSIEHDRRVVIYPDYIDARNTVKRGRKVPVPPGARRAGEGRGMMGTAQPWQLQRRRARPLRAGCEQPTLKEIMDCLEHLKLPAEVEVGGRAGGWVKAALHRGSGLRSARFATADPHPAPAPAAEQGLLAQLADPGPDTRAAEAGGRGAHQPGHPEP